jgi:hypothetical protein
MVTDDGCRYGSWEVGWQIKKTQLAIDYPSCNMASS